jgi:hypothetical protein
MTVFARQQQGHRVTIAAQRYREKSGCAEWRLKQQYEFAGARRERCAQTQ